jgi:uncharacterized protein
VVTRAAGVTMAQQGSVQASATQREPSMEEILASIRRIIEDSDTVRGPDAGVGEEAVGEPSAIVEEQVEAFREELAEPVSHAQPDENEPPMSRQPNSLRELQASMGMDAGQGRASAPSAEIHELPQPVSRMIAPEPAPMSSPEPAFEDPALFTDMHRAEPVEALPMPAHATRDDIASTQMTESSQASNEPISSILSAEAGRQVKAAFGELNDAFSAQRRRNLDEMAREMLRPMLQEWLDNNLPTIVEKLVREEIERVARGG